MAWRLRPPGSEAEGAPREKSPHRDKDEEGEDEDEENSHWAIPLHKLTLNTAQKMREVEAALLTTYIISPDHELVVRGKQAGGDYDKQVQKDKKGHELGPPFIHIFMASL